MYVRMCVYIYIHIDIYILICVFIYLCYDVCLCVCLCCCLCFALLRREEVGASKRFGCYLVCVGPELPMLFFGVGGLDGLHWGSGRSRSWNERPGGAVTATNIEGRIASTHM